MERGVIGFDKEILWPSLNGRKNIDPALCAVLSVNFTFTLLITSIVR